MKSKVVACVVAVMWLASVQGALAEGPLTVRDTHMFLLWEDANGFSEDVAKTEGPIQAITEVGRSLQMVVDVILEGEPNSSFENPAVLSVTARSTANGEPVLEEKQWQIRTIGDFGTAMRTVVVDHDCNGVVVDVTVEVDGKVSDTWRKQFEIVCQEAS